MREKNEAIPLAPAKNDRPNARRFLITAGPTREAIDAVRFISNGSSGRMGFAIAAAALAAGHDVTLLAGPVSLPAPPAARTLPFVSVADLKGLLEREFPSHDVLVMAAAVGDFRLERPFDRKLSRKAGPIALTLIPTEDVLAAVAARKRADQFVVSFAVEDGPQGEVEAKARAELESKHGDIVVVNTPSAMGAAESLAAILSRDACLLPWAVRPKEQLAKEIVRLVAGHG